MASSPCNFLSFKPTQQTLISSSFSYSSSSSSSHLSFLHLSSSSSHLSFLHLSSSSPIPSLTCRRAISRSDFSSFPACAFKPSPDRWTEGSSSSSVLCRSGYNVQVVVEDNEPEESLIRRFRSKVLRAGVIQECKRRRFFENRQEEKKRKTRESAKRNRRRRPAFRVKQSDKQEESVKKDADEAEDNWEIPEGALPY